MQADGQVLVDHIGAVVFLIGACSLQISGELIRHVGLTDDHIYVTNQHVFKLHGLGIGIDLHGVAKLCICGQLCKELQRPLTVLDQRLGKHTHKLTRDLFAVLGFGCPAPNAQSLTALYHHIRAEYLGYGKICCVSSIKRVTNHNVGFFCRYFLSCHLLCRHLLCCLFGRVLGRLCGVNTRGHVLVTTCASNRTCQHDAAKQK